MDRPSYLTFILSLVVLSALPLYCEPRTEESPNSDLKEEKAVRIKRGLHIISAYDDASFKLPKIKDTRKEREASRERDDSKRVKRRNPQSRLKSNGKKNSQPTMDGQKKQQKPTHILQENKNDKRAKTKPESKTKISAKREIKLNTSKDSKSSAKKRESGRTNKTANELEHIPSDKTSPIKDIGNELEDKHVVTCVDKNGEVIIADQTKDNIDKGEVDVPSFYFKTVPRVNQGTVAKRNDAEEHKGEDNGVKELKTNTIRDKIKYTDVNKKYNSKNYKKPIMREKPAPKHYVARVKKTIQSRKKN